MGKRTRRFSGALVAVILAAVALAALPAVASAVEDSDTPAKFDLREKGVVTSVKKQDPWNTCWAFSASAASEISALTALGMTSDQFKQQTGNELDLSEKHLAWFASKPVTASVDPAQEGEGIYRAGGSTDPNDAYNNGGFNLLVTGLFSSGMGPVEESLFPYQGKTGLTEKQYLKAYPDFGRAYVRKITETQLGMTLEEAVSKPEDQKVKAVLDRLYADGYLDKSVSLTAELLEDARYRLYVDNYAGTTSYFKGDDWTIPELNESGQANRNVTSGFTLKDGNILPSLSNKDADGKWESVNWDGVAAVKSELMEGHGVSAGIKADQASPGDPIGEGSYLNTATWAHYTNEDVGQNHAICIVGWDDDYPVENFNEGRRPPGNGAWIAKNSWGSETDCQEATEDSHIGYDAWGFVDESGKHTGYFYISYYDKTLDGCESMSYSTELASSGEGFSTWMYDYMPALTKLDMDTTVQSSSLTKTANVFKNDTGGYVQLASVSTKTAQPNATVRYSVYQLGKDAKNPEDGKLLAEFSGSYKYKGFHRESLKDDVAIGNGETIAVVAEETVNDKSEGKLYEYTVNAASTQERAVSTGESPFYGVAVVNKGESFIYEDGAWTDWSEYGKRAELSGQYAIDNFSIKAYMVAKGDTCAMHRLYNPWSYEHFYTSDDEEFEGLVALGWADEGIGWVSPAESDTPVFRLYNPYNGGDHHYTKDAEERDYLVSVGWVDEEVGWYSFDETGTPVYREYNPNELARNHNYTTDKGEHDGLVALGWHDEEIAWYGVPSNDADLQAASL